MSYSKYNNKSNMPHYDSMPYYKTERISTKKMGNSLRNTNDTEKSNYRYNPYNTEIPYNNSISNNMHKMPSDIDYGVPYNRGIPNNNKVYGLQKTENNMYTTSMPNGDIPAMPATPFPYGDVYNIPFAPGSTMPNMPMPTVPYMPNDNNIYPSPSGYNGLMPSQMNCQQLMELMQQMNCMEELQNMTQNNKNTQNTQSTQNIQNTQNIENTQNTEEKTDSDSKEE